MDGLFRVCTGEGEKKRWLGLNKRGIVDEGGALDWVDSRGKASLFKDDAAKFFAYKYKGEVEAVGEHETLPFEKNGDG